jgi:hypothetical protein
MFIPKHTKEKDKSLAFDDKQNTRRAINPLSKLEEDYDKILNPKNPSELYMTPAAPLTFPEEENMSPANPFR